MARLVEAELRGVIASLLSERPKTEKEAEQIETSITSFRGKGTSTSPSSPATNIRYEVDVVDDDANANYVKITKENAREMTEEALREKVRSFFGIDDLREWRREPVGGAEEEAEEKGDIEEIESRNNEEAAEDESPAPPPPPPPPLPPPLPAPHISKESIFPSSLIETPIQTPKPSPPSSARTVAIAVQTSFADGEEEEEQMVWVDTPLPSEIADEYDQDSFHVSGF